MWKRVISLVCVGWLSIAACSSEGAPPSQPDSSGSPSRLNMGIVTGVLRDPAGTPLASGDVVIEAILAAEGGGCVGDPMIWNASTDRNGEFRQLIETASVYKQLCIRVSAFPPADSDLKPKTIEAAPLALVPRERSANANVVRVEIELSR